MHDCSVEIIAIPYVWQEVEVDYDCCGFNDSQYNLI